MTKRTDRVGEAIRRLASEIIQNELHDPRVQGIITVTRVQVTQDLRFAKIYYSVMGDEKAKSLVAKGLKSAKGFFRKRIAEELKLRFAADIAFVLEEAMDSGEKINRILEELRKEGENGDNR